MRMQPIRQLDEGKVLELMTSFEACSVINPISVDEALVLIAGAHRLEAAKQLGWETIRRFVFNRGISDYPIIVNPAGQIVEMDDKTPLDLIMQVTNASISCAYDQLCRI